MDRSRAVNVEGMNGMFGELSTGQKLSDCGFASGHLSLASTM